MKRYIPISVLFWVLLGVLSCAACAPVTPAPTRLPGMTVMDVPVPSEQGNVIPRLQRLAAVLPWKGMPSAKMVSSVGWK